MNRLSFTSGSTRLIFHASKSGVTSRAAAIGRLPGVGVAVEVRRLCSECSIIMGLSQLKGVCRPVRLVWLGDICELCKTTTQFNHQREIAS